jgi:hypothetical protein
MAPKRRSIASHLRLFEPLSKGLSHPAHVGRCPAAVKGNAFATVHMLVFYEAAGVLSKR